MKNEIMKAQWTVDVSLFEALCFTLGTFFAKMEGSPIRFVSPRLALDGYPICTHARSVSPICSRPITRAPYLSKCLSRDANARRVFVRVKIIGSALKLVFYMQNTL